MRMLGRIVAVCVVVAFIVPSCVLENLVEDVAVPGWQDEEWMRAGVMAKLLGPGDPGYIDPEQAVDPPPDRYGEKWVEGAAHGKVR